MIRLLKAVLLFTSCHVVVAVKPKIGSHNLFASLSLISAVMGLVGLPSDVKASPSVWSLTPVSFSNGQMLSGSFRFDGSRATGAQIYNVDLTYFDGATDHQLTAVEYATENRLIVSKAGTNTPAANLFAITPALTDQGGDVSYTAYVGNLNGSNLTGSVGLEAQAIIGVAGLAPPFSDTVYIERNWITPADPSTFSSISSIGLETVSMFDRRTNNFEQVEAHSFVLAFSSSVEVTARVNPEFDAERAESLAGKWGQVLGQMPSGLIRELGELHIQGGDKLMGGNGLTNPTVVLIHEEHGDRNLQNGWAEEEILHELGHAVFQPLQMDTDWVAAQDSDPCFISNYARDYPDREDIAETLAPYLIMTHRTDRISASNVEAIAECIGARTQVLDAWFATMGLSYTPFGISESATVSPSVLWFITRGTQVHEE
jgi:hypothetical protein